VRLLGEDLAILEGAGLGLVGVADRVPGLGLLRRDGLPLHAGRKAGAAHAAQAGVLQRRDDLLGAQLTVQGAAEHAVALLADGVRVVGPGLAAALQRGGLAV